MSEFMTAADVPPEAEAIWRAVADLQDDPVLQRGFRDRLKKYELNLLKLQADALSDLNELFIDSESFFKEKEKRLRWNR